MGAVEARLVQAIGDVLVAMDALGEGHVMGDWHVMVEISNLESPGLTRYANIIPGSGLPMHRVLGLIEVCTDMLEED